MMECTGEENHSHYKLATGDTIYHTHKHSVMSKDFNRLHHHPPVEHSDFTDEELHKDHSVMGLPF